jgi:hypothetical protein
MNKVKLNFDQLQVETFETLPVRSDRGTVLGANIPPPTNPNRDCKPIPISTFCPPETMAVTCPASCPETCPHTCGILCTAGCT